MPLTKASINVDVDLTTIENDIENLQTNDALQDTSINSLISDVSDISSELETLSESVIAIPSTVKTTAASGDYFIGIDSDGLLYKITKENLLAGLTSGGGGDDGGDSGSTTDPFFSSVVFLSHGNSTTDVTGKTITLVSNAAISTLDPKFTGGSSFSFDGSGDYASIAASSALNFSTGQDFTIEMFVRFNSISGVKTLIARSIDSSDNTFNLDLTSTNIRLTGWYTVYINAAHGMTTDTWYYVAVTRQGNVLKVYIDGVLKGSYTGTTNFPNVNNFTIGGDPLSGTTYTIDGKVTEVRMSNIARTIGTVPTTKFPDN